MAFFFFFFTAGNLFALFLVVYSDSSLVMTDQILFSSLPLVPKLNF